MPDRAVVGVTPSARRETIFMDMSVACTHADIGAPLAGTVFASDAIGAGEGDEGSYGVVAGNANADLGRWWWPDASVLGGGRASTCYVRKPHLILLQTSGCCSLGSSRP